MFEDSLTLHHQVVRSDGAEEWVALEFDYVGLFLAFLTALLSQERAKLFSRVVERSHGLCIKLFDFLDIAAELQAIAPLVRTFQVRALLAFQFEYTVGERLNLLGHVPF